MSSSYYTIMRKCSPSHPFAEAAQTVAELPTHRTERGILRFPSSPILASLWFPCVVLTLGAIRRLLVCRVLIGGSLLGAAQLICKLGWRSRPTGVGRYPVPQSNITR